MKRGNKLIKIFSGELENLTCFMKSLDFFYDEKLRCGRHQVYLNDERGDEKKRETEEKQRKSPIVIVTRSIYRFSIREL